MRNKNKKITELPSLSALTGEELFALTDGNRTYHSTIDTIINSVGSYGHIFFVSLEGDDSKGEMGNINRPFKEIHSAVTAAVDSGFDDTLIYVWPGEFTANEIQYEGGSFYFSPGTTIKNRYYVGTDLNYIFRLGDYTTSHTGNIVYTSSTVNVFGDGDFLGVSDSAHTWWSTPFNIRGNSSMYLNCNSVELGAGTGLFVGNEGNLIANVNTITSTDGGYLVSVRDNATINLTAKKLHVKEPPSVGVNTSIGVQIGSQFAPTNPSQSNVRIGTLIWDVPPGTGGGTAPLLIDSLTTGNKLIVNIDTIESVSRGLMVGSVTGGEAVININKISSVGPPIHIDNSHSDFIGINAKYITTESNMFIKNSENIYINVNNAFTTSGDKICDIFNSDTIFDGNYYSERDGFFINDLISNIIYDDVYIKASEFSIDSAFSDTNISVLQSLSTNTKISENIIIDSGYHNYLNGVKVQELEVLEAGGGIIMTSPGGMKYKLIVDDEGLLTTIPV